jgi:hypothetical protein
MSAAQVRPYKSGLVAQLTLEPTPTESARAGIEVIRTYSASCVRINMPKIVNGFAYRCLACNEFWSHRIQAYRHQCIG